MSTGRETRTCALSATACLALAWLIVPVSPPASAFPPFMVTPVPADAMLPDSVFTVSDSAQMEAYHKAHPPTRREPKKLKLIDPPPRGIDGTALKRLRGGAPAPAAQRAVAPAPNGGPLLAPPTLTSFVGQADNATTIPPDTDGAVGPSHVFSFLNTGRTIYNKTGGLVASQVGLTAFWGALGTAAGQPARFPSDPRVLWDHYAGRWLVSAIGTNALSGDGTNAWMLVGISQTGDPTGAWNLFAIRVNLTAGFNHNSHVNDFIVMGFDPNNVILTTNIFNRLTFAFVHSDAYVINKASLIAGGTLTFGTDYTIFHNPCGAVVGANIDFSPCVTFGQTPGTGVNYLLDNGWYDTVDLTLRYFRVSTVNGTGAAATLDCMGDLNFVFHSGCYNFNVAPGPQPGCSGIETNRSQITAPGVVRNGNIWLTHHAGAPGAPCPDPMTNPAATRAEVWWYEVDPAHVVAPGTPEQFGVVSDPSRAYYFPSIGVNAGDGVLLAFSGSSSLENVGGYYTGRNGCDPPNTMQSVGLMKAGEDTYFKTFGGGRNRWGDYSAVSVDPVDDQTLWTVQEYARPESGGNCVDGSGRWGTWWASVKPCPLISASPASLPAATIGTPYLQSLVGAGGTGPYSFALSSGSLPQGLVLLANGDLNGTPAHQAGVFNFTVGVADSASCACNQAYTLTVSCANPGDANIDTFKDSIDVQHFVDCFMTGTTPGGFCGCADIDQDGDVDENDRNLFVLALIS